MKDVRLTTQNSTGVLDLQIDNGGTSWAEDGTEVAQHGSIRLQKFIGESVIEDEEEDFTRWYSVIFDAQKSRVEKEYELKRRILGTTGVIRILTFTWTQIDKTVNITGSVLTEWGTVDISEEVTPL